MISTIKTYVISGALVLLVAIGSGAYIKHQSNKIESLNGQVTSLKTDNVRLENQLQAQADSYEDEIGRLNESLNQYTVEIEENRNRVAVLRRKLNETSEELKVCLRTELPNDIIDRLFNDN